jgi:hypothetical protein
MQEVGCEKSPVDASEDRGERLTLERAGNEMKYTVVQLGGSIFSERRGERAAGSEPWMKYTVGSGRATA